MPKRNRGSDFQRILAEPRDLRRGTRWLDAKPSRVFRASSRAGMHGALVLEVGRARVGVLVTR